MGELLQRRHRQQGVQSDRQLHRCAVAPVVAHQAQGQATQGRDLSTLAPLQIAVPLRLFVVEDTQARMSYLTPEQQKARNRYPIPFEVVINPIWYATSPEMVIETEGCLSIPGFKADVCRYWAIEVEGFQPNGQRKTWSVKGWPARIFQHEIDHLDGRLLTDCMLPRTLTSTEPHGTGASSDLLQRLAISIQPPKEK
jgi:peptide deformylase